MNTREDTGRTLGASFTKKRQWTSDEDELVLKHEVSDRELSLTIRRSLSAIQKRRSILIKECR